ncbi:painless [Leptinotarsa decemlineata]|uniref:painless n=1 Tax=Leptinotarsa decemlineata TaxID=7539 RepID=UPI003D30C23F
MYTKLPGDRSPIFTRTNSICPTPESVLLELVLQNDRENIQSIVQNQAKLLTHLYIDYNKPILSIACSSEQVEAETVTTLIDLGADLQHFNAVQWQAIHFAAQRTNSKVLRVVVEALLDQGLDVNSLQQSNNSLHILIRFGKNEEHDEFLECAKLLIKNGIDVNAADSKFMSPILWAAKKGYRDMIELILVESPVPVDIDSHQSRGKTARDIILSENLYDGILPEKFVSLNDKDDVVLFNHIKTRNENGFINFKNGDIFELVNSDDGSSTLLQMSCDNGLKRVVKHLIDKGADPNLGTAKNAKKPIEIAAEHGFYEIFQILLDHPKIKIPKTILMTLLKHYDEDKFPGIDWAECYRRLHKKLQSDNSILDINDVDYFQSSSLHYAVRYSDPETVMELLDLGASLGSKNEFGTMPICDIEPELLEKHLDKCVEFDPKGKKDKEDFSVTFKYRTLIPPPRKIEKRDVSDSTDSEQNLNNQFHQELVHETEVIFYMSQSPEFKHLLKHPVIVSFLFIKWHRIRWLFYTNLAFYVAFFMSLVVYVFTEYANFNKERSSFEVFLGQSSEVVLIITFFLLVLRELFQIAVSPWKYFKNFENYIEITLILITGALLFITDPSNDTRKQLSSISILLAAFELVLMVGQHPKLSTNVVMLRTVSFNFFKFLMWYSLLIIAFALSFYILFTESPSEKSGNTTGEEKEEEDYFTDPGKSMFKTIIMLTGEFDASDINFHTFPIISKLIFVLFIFMIAIILLNLLNGLAVSDTQMIKTDAELLGHIYRAQYIMYVESMLLGNIIPRNLLNKIEDLCCCCPFNKDWNYRALQPLARRACLFPHFLYYEMTVYPNRGGQIAIHNTVKKGNLGNCCFGCCSSISLDKDTIKRTNNIVQARREQMKIKQEVSYIHKMEALVLGLETNTRSEIFMLNKKLDYILKYINQERTE